MSNTQESTTVRKRELWQRRVERWRQSGMSMRAYCRQENISYYGLRYWKDGSEANNGKRRAVKIAVPVAMTPASENEAIEVVIAERYRVRIPQGFQQDHLERVIRSLEAVR